MPDAAVVSVLGSVTNFSSLAFLFIVNVGKKAGKRKKKDSNCRKGERWPQDDTLVAYSLCSRLSN